VALLAVVLHLGQVEFKPDPGRDEFFAPADPTVLDDIEKLSGVPPASLSAALVSRTMVTRGETMVIPLKLEQCRTARDAVARHLYKALFSHLVAKINGSVGRAAPAGAGLAEINVLDIFGFESFRANTFEQLCINYTNECLQEQFNRHVFQQQQEEYAREGIG
jgi:myosin-5